MISEFQDLYSRRHELARKWKRERGKVFGYIYSLVPKEIIHAAGILPVQIMEDEGDYYTSRSGMESFVCGFARNSTGQALEGAYDYLDGVVMLTVCDTNRHLYDIWKRGLNLSFLHLISSPNTRSTTSMRYYAGELERFRDAISREAGSRITDDSLRHSIELFNEGREMIRTLYERRTGAETGLKGSHVLRILKAALGSPPETFNQLLARFLKEPPHGERSRAKVKILLSAVNFNLAQRVMEIVEGAGGAVVMDDLNEGIRCFSHNIELGPDPIESLVEGYLGRIPSPGLYPADAKVEMIISEMKRSGTQGVICTVQKFCDIFALQYPSIIQKLRDKGIPVLYLDLEDAELSSEQLRTRVESFMEIVS